MAYEKPGEKDGHHRAAGDLRALRYRAMVLNGSGLIAQNTVAGGRIHGVLQNKPDVNHACELMLTGVTKMVAGAAVAQGVPVASDNQGRAIAATGTNIMIGRAETAAGAAGEIISVALSPIQAANALA
jgi:hypothetical protein